DRPPVASPSDIARAASDQATPERSSTTASPEQPRSRRSRVPWLGIGLVAMVGSLVLALAIGPASVAGPAPITPAEILGSAWHHLTGWLASLGLPVEVAENPLSRIRDAIIWDGRAPRALAAVLVG